MIFMRTYLGLFHCGSGAISLLKWGDFTSEVGRLQYISCGATSPVTCTWIPLEGSVFGGTVLRTFLDTNFAFSFKLRCNFVNLLLWWNAIIFYATCLSIIVVWFLIACLGWNLRRTAKEPRRFCRISEYLCNWSTNKARRQLVLTFLRTFVQKYGVFMALSFLTEARMNVYCYIHSKGATGLTFKMSHL